MKSPTRRFKVKRLKHIGLLPTLVTLGNIVCGFAAVVFASRSMVEGALKHAADASHYFELGAWMVIIAMVFDALDGRVARMTGSASKFGAELDSLCDAVSFGLAPAFLAYVTIDAFPGIVPRKVAIAICAVYAACAVLRLARFNVETTLDEEAHMSFRGLPSPAAAGVVVSLVLLRTHLADTRLADAVVILLPFAVLGSGIAMISNLRYTHLVNKLLRGHHRFARMAEVVLVALMAAIDPEVTITLGFCGYALSGPVMWFFRKPQPVIAPGGTPTPEKKPSRAPGED
ncbi:MAG: CDP-diacylglycerol--serine O-phosphatidyltransferase [Planctomycetes bacterium]|nr:CDP-diacylglycerol--serine O-phosphatidyltransferase [Planctomycetota bacterium]